MSSSELILPDFNAKADLLLTLSVVADEVSARTNLEMAPPNSQNVTSYWIRNSFCFVLIALDNDASNPVSMVGVLPAGIITSANFNGLVSDAIRFLELENTEGVTPAALPDEVPARRVLQDELNPVAKAEANGCMPA